MVTGEYRMKVSSRNGKPTCNVSKNITQDLLKKNKIESKYKGDIEECLCSFIQGATLLVVGGGVQMWC